MVGQRDILLHLVGFMEEYKIPYLLTGSFAVSYYGFPRATHDIDFVVEIQSAEKNNILKLLQRLGQGFDYNEESVIKAIESYRQFAVFHFDTGIKIDFWIRRLDEFERNKFKATGIFEIASALSKPKAMNWTGSICVFGPRN